MIHEPYLVVDIECHQPTGEADVDTAQLRYVGFRHFKGRNICLYYPTDKEKIQNILNSFKYIVGHYIKLYDKPVLENHGFTFPFGINVIDTYTIADNRMKSMMYIDLNSGDRSLKRLSERFNLPSKKGEFDFKLLEKEVLDGEEYKLLETYLVGDLETCDELFKYFYEFFYGFRMYMSKQNQDRLSWLTCRPGSTAYKCICNIADLPEEYDDTIEDTNEVGFEGAFVSSPYKEFDSGDIYCCDFSSLYPHMMMGFNLYSSAKDDEEYWNGSMIYPSQFGNNHEGLVGKYSRNIGKVERAIQKLYTSRVEVTDKLKNPNITQEEKNHLEKERLAIKILINTIYGVSGSPKFKSVYSKTTASDCTAMGRRTILHARTCLESKGYECLYTDTDSVYFKDPFGSSYKVNETIEWISKWQRESMNIPIETHSFVIENKIKYIYFFKDEDGSYKNKEFIDYVKKQYIYVTDEGKIKEKGIRIVRGDCSPVAKDVYVKHIKPLALQGVPLRFSAEEITNWIKEEIKINPERLKKRYRLKPFDTYKIPEGKDESSALYAQLSKKYGPGEFHFVVNKRIGPGKLNHYCTLEELQQKYGDHWIDQIRIEMYLSDLKCFIIDEDRKKIK